MKSSLPAALLAPLFVLAVTARADDNGPTPGYALAWKQLPGSARDVGVGANGTAWIVGTDKKPGGYGIYRWNDGKSSWDNMGGAGLTIDVDPAGNAYVADESGKLYKWENNAWTDQKVQSATEVGIASDGNVWLVSNKQAHAGGGFDALYRDPQTGYFQGMVCQQIAPGWKNGPYIFVACPGLVRMSAMRGGTGFGVDDQGTLLATEIGPPTQPNLPCSAVQRYYQRSPPGNDVGVGANDDIYLALRAGGVLHLNGRAINKFATPGVFARISAGDGTRPWAVSDAGKIFVGQLTEPQRTRHYGARAGTVHTYDKNRGYGYLTPGNGDKDIFWHFSAVVQGCLDYMAVGAEVRFDIQVGPKGQTASNVWPRACPTLPPLQ